MNTNFFKTRKLFLKLALLLSFSLSVTNCSKDSDLVTKPSAVLAPLQDPLPGYLAASGFNQKTANIDGNFFYSEVGFSFIPLLNGKMTAIVVKIPYARLGIRVTVWDKVAGTIIRTETIDLETAGVEVTKQITTLDLVKDKEYFITMLSNCSYFRSKTNNTTVTYPFTVGDFKITTCSYRDGTAQTMMPNTPVFNGYSGDCSFKFQK